MTAYEAFTRLQALLREALPQADFRESYGPARASRLPSRPVAAGQVGAESSEGGEWSARIDYRLFLPRGAGPAVGEGILEEMARVAGENFPALKGVDREGFAPDQGTGLLSARLSLQLAKGKGAGKAVAIGGIERRAAGWEVACAPGKELTAVGEGEPFATVGGMGYTVKLTGIDTAGLERLAGFSAVLGDLAFTGCRWKEISETGKRAAFVSRHMERRAQGHGEP